MSRDYLPIILFVLPILWIVSITLMIDYLMVGIILNGITIFVAFICTIKYSGIRRRLKKENKKEITTVSSDFEEKYSFIYAKKFRDNNIEVFLKSLNKDIHYKVRKDPRLEDEVLKNVSNMCRYLDIRHSWLTIYDEIYWKMNEQTKCDLFNAVLVGGRHHSIIFKGLFGTVGNSGCNIEPSVRISLKERFAGNGTKIVMNNIAFEDGFSVHSRNKDVVDLIVTEELMNCIMKIYEESNLDFFITIKGNAIYYQFFTGSQTDVRNFQHKNFLFCYYYAIKIMEETSKIINKNLSQIEASILKLE